MNSLTMPSGRRFYGQDMALMKDAVSVGFVKWFDEERTLASGRKSHVYVQGREDTTQSPEFLHKVCRKILIDTREIMEEANDLRRPRFIGIPHVAHGFTPALAMVDYQDQITRRNACFVIMRSKPKDYGGKPGRWVEGAVDTATFRDIQFDNVVTDSGSKAEANERMFADGFTIDELDAMVFVDRQQGGLEAMRKMGYRHVHANYFLLDMADAFGKLELWTADAVEKVRREITDNQVS